ncbi:MAG: transglycosylase SLT domain-containing protein [Deltaproteobacteria bacterium]|nr:transglycosylase SLT domain-containing protein [Deltaproteobacteria bacterium]
MQASARITPTKRMTYAVSFVSVFLAFLAWMPVSRGASAYPVLAESIIEYNQKAQRKILSDGEYMGHAGILLMGPDLARTFGFKTLIDEDYTQGKALHEKAERLFDEAVAAMTTQGKETAPGEHAERVGELGLAYHTTLVSARTHLGAYRLKLNPEVDDRLNPEKCSALMDTLLAHAFEAASYNLREGLGAFYNRTQGLPGSHPFLTPDNIRFVNHVFNAFVQNAPEAARKPYDLGRQDLGDRANPGTAWKSVVEHRARPFIQYLDPLIQEWKQGRYPVDPLLFIALMKRESNLDPRAVSYVGAVGLTQIMPKTGKGLGMKQIYMPPYFDKAIDLYREERKLNHRAKSTVKQITDKSMLEKGKRARQLMQKSLDYRIKRTHLLARYRKDLLEKNWDDRLKPELAIRYGYTYFSQMMKRQKGDISLALAAYNAGPHRVQQYNGIPPFRKRWPSETGLWRFTGNISTN